MLNCASEALPCHEHFILPLSTTACSRVGRTAATGRSEQAYTSIVFFAQAPAAIGGYVIVLVCDYL